MVRGARVAVSRRFLDFTAHQDLQLSAGLDLDWPKAAKTAVGSSSSKINTVGLLPLFFYSSAPSLLVIQMRKRTTHISGSAWQVFECVMVCTGPEAALWKILPPKNRSSLSRVQYRSFH
jgi:hypothetical protein